MINAIIITNHFGKSLTLELACPEKSGLAVLDVKGLGPVKASVNMKEVTGYDGKKFASAIATNRNIVLKLKYMHPVVENRLKTYEYFPLKKKLKIEIQTDTKNVFTYGYVESNEADIFSPDSGCSVSIMCEDSYFQSSIASNTVFYGINAGFEFPFSNESLTEPTIVFSEVETDLIKNIQYDGEVETGFEMIIDAKGTVENIKVYDMDTREVMAIDTDKLEALTGQGLGLGDTISIQTRQGYRSATLFRDDEEINIINVLGKHADWFVLEKGSNLFAYTAEEGLFNAEFRVVHRILYEGV